MIGRLTAAFWAVLGTLALATAALGTLALATLAVPGPAWAAPSGTAQGGATAYALVVGSNAGGKGQAPLRYAEQDAQRMAELLATLGGVPAEHVTQLLAPTAAELQAALGRLEETLHAHAQAGEPTRLYFYYSGHARANALNLGDEQVALAALKERIVALPATLSIAVLDACQSGAFARAKGASPTADFSFNSVEQLRTEGIAVIASSSSAELSQESDELQAGHFSHHLLVGLRGAGDVDGDGSVTLSEAYTYAYNRTLDTTAVTTIGQQHVMLENDLRGHGDVALTRPAQADARLIVPASLRARVLVQRLPKLSVMAELDKASGDEVRLGLPAGSYRATVRLADAALRCPFTLERGASFELSTSGCVRVAFTPALSKGGGEPRPMTFVDGTVREGEEGFFLELGFGRTSYRRKDAFDARLREFGFSANRADQGLDLDMSLGRRLGPYLAFGLSYFDLDAFEYVRDATGQDYRYASTAITGFAQADYPFDDQRMFSVFARAGGGYGWTSTEFDAYPVLSQDADLSPIELAAGDRTTTIEQTHSGAVLALSAGLSLMPFPNVGLSAQARYTFAPVLENALGETHDVGGFTVVVSLRLRTWEAK